MGDVTVEPRAGKVGTKVKVSSPFIANLTKVSLELNGNSLFYEAKAVTGDPHAYTFEIGNAGPGGYSLVAHFEGGGAIDIGSFNGYI